MRLPVFGKAKYPREEMERVAAQELAAALEVVPQPPDPSLASWAVVPAPVSAPTPAVVATAEDLPEPAVTAPGRAG